MGIGSINRQGLRWLAWLVASLALVATLGTAAARADVTINVNTTTDETTTGNGTCSLREAVLYANGTAESDCAAATATGTTTIALPAGHYVITSSLSITGATVVNGSGASNTIIDANGASGVISVGAAAQVRLNGVTVTGGNSGQVACTGSFLVCLLFGTAGAPGGGISNAGSLTLSGSAVTNNVAAGGTSGIGAGSSAHDGGAGGGIYNTGTLSIADSTISGNKTSAGDGNAAALPTSAGAGNPGGAGGASGSGGGIFTSGATVTIARSTITGNSTGKGGNGANGSDANTAGAGGAGGAGGAAGSGGGIESATSGALTISSSTITGNTTGAGGAGGNGGTGLGGANAGGAAGAGGNGGSGGGIDSAPQATVQNSTLTGNATGGGGPAGVAGTGPLGGAGAAAGSAGTGGALNQSSTSATLLQSTVASNTSAGTGGGLNQTGGSSISIEDSIVASNHTGSAASNCGGTMYVLRGSNVLFGDNSCGTAGGDPKLQPLADNGGPVQTMSLGAGSSAIDAVPTNDCLATDERGVVRPQGPKCDAGAYELAAPSVSGVSAGASSTTMATVIASVNPNFKATTVAVRYGTTTAYGTTTPAQNLGSANAATSFSARLTALAPNTTYHAQVVATNADGTTASSDVSFTTSTSVSAALASASVKANKLAVTIVCDHGNPTDRCAGPITLSAHVTTAKGKPIAVSSAKPQAKKKKPKPVKKKTTVVKLASSTYSVATGHRATIVLTLNKKGRGLLNALYKVPATLKLGGTTSATRQVTFSYGRVRSPVSFTWKFNKRYTVAQLLTIGSLPAKPKVLVSCHGGGCPFAKRTFSLKAKSKTRKLALAPKLKQAHLKPKATLQIVITAANAVGKVLTFTIVSNDVPKLAVSCLVPGARKPTACASP